MARARTAAVYLLPAALVAANWLRLEDPRGSGGRIVWVVLLAFVPALAPTLRARVALAVAAMLLAFRAAFGVSPLDARPFDGRHDYFGPLLSDFRNGFLDFYDVAVPFDPGRHVVMHGVILVAIFAFSLAIALAAAARKPVPAVLALVVGAGWPATLLAGGNELGRGAMILAGALVLLGGLSVRDGGALARGLVASVAVVLASLAASTSPAVAKTEFLNWQTWDFYTRPEKPVSVRYVWDANYTGLDWPNKVTEVLRVKAPPRSLYWRATTLDVFNGEAWIEDLTEILPSRGAAYSSTDPLLPQAARDSRKWIKQEVTVEALKDRHLVGGDVPVAFTYDPRSVGQVRFGRGAVAFAPSTLSRGERYTVWSYVPSLSPTQLARSKPVYPEAIDLGGFLDVQRGIAVPPFGAPGRDEWVRKLFDLYRYDATLPAYKPLYQTAKEVVGNPTSPYAAALKLESWFRTQGGFSYDENPPQVRGVPPLVAFVTQTKRGYCQHYAGAMALMLRYLGIPARVAAGFTSGRYDYDHGIWKVTDHDAHTWVEVWFKGYGWLPFDPTPARGRLSGAYSISSQTFDVKAAIGLLGSSALGENTFAFKLDHGFGEKGVAPTDARSGADVRRGGGRLPGAARRHGASLLRFLALLAAAVAAAIVLAKFVLRRSRYLTRDPRRLAAASRRELTDFLADQRIPLPPGATLRELGELVDAELSVVTGPFVAAATAARYGPPGGAPRAAVQARREVRALQRELRRQLTVSERIRGLFSLRSLGFSS